MEHTLLFDVIINSLLYPSLLKHLWKPDYTYIQDTYFILTNNKASIKSLHRGGQNGNHRLFLIET